MLDWKLISSDSHIVEPPNLWTVVGEEGYREGARSHDPTVVAAPSGRDHPSMRTVVEVKLCSVNRSFHRAWPVDVQSQTASVHQPSIRARGT